MPGSWISADGRRPHLVVTDGHTLSGLDIDLSVLQRFGSLDVYDRCAEHLVERTQTADIVITNKERFDAQTLAQLPKLRFISVLATGTDVIDLAAARQRNVVVSNAPAYSSASVAQHVFALLLEIVNHPFEHAQAASRGDWSASGHFSCRVTSLQELCGLTLGLVGVGSIGSRVAALGTAFGMRVVAAHQRSEARVKLTHPEIEWLPLDDVFRRADVLSLHCPLTEQTRQLVNTRRLALMKPNAILINTGRGPLIDEAALERALSRNELHAAGLDVLCVEPPPADHPLLHTCNCVVTPHVAWATTAARSRLLDITVKNVAGFLAGSPVNVVHP